MRSLPWLRSDKHLKNHEVTKCYKALRHRRDDSETGMYVIESFGDTAPVQAPALLAFQALINYLVISSIAAQSPNAYYSRPRIDIYRCDLI